jgi:hypothetical protein
MLSTLLSRPELSTRLPVIGWWFWPTIPWDREQNITSITLPAKQPSNVQRRCAECRMPRGVARKRWREVFP